MAKYTQSKMQHMGKEKSGGLPPRYGFMLNPYPDMRISSCPLCEQRTGQSKIPLVIYVKPLNFIFLNYTCRYCAKCDLLVANKHKVEHLLTEMFRQNNPEIIGNEYLIMGTVDKKVWRAGFKQPQVIADTLSYVSNFAKYYQELLVTQPGWYQVGQKPPMMKPPPSQEWVKL